MAVMGREPMRVLRVDERITGGAAERNEYGWLKKKSMRKTGSQVTFI